MIKAIKLRIADYYYILFALLCFVYHLTWYSSDDEQSFETVLLFDLDSASPPARFGYHCNPSGLVHWYTQLVAAVGGIFYILFVTVFDFVIVFVFWGFDGWMIIRPLPPPVRTTCVSCCFWWCSPSAGLQLGEEDVPGGPSTFVRTIITYVHDT